MASPQPPWHDQPPPPGSWRSLFKWGAPEAFKHPNAGLLRQLKRVLALEDRHFQQPRALGLEPASFQAPTALAPERVAALAALLGPGGVATDPFTRLGVAYGKTMLDLLRLRQGIAEHLPDAVLYPRDRHDVARIVAFCTDHRLPITPFGGGSSVTRGVECPRGGVSLDLRRHMNKIIRFNEADQTITVEAGMYGPELERLLNGAPRLLGATRPYTCGHFPQSFEFSTVGGWAATRGAGQNSTYFGKIEDLVLCQTMVTPAGVLRTGYHPAAATGPDTDQILLGSEGAFGVLTEVTLRIFRHWPRNQFPFSYLFPRWQDACGAAREVLQSQAGLPSAFRLSDPEETEFILSLYGAQSLARLLGMQRGQCCLLLGSTDGARGFARQVRRQVGRICRGASAIPTGAFVARAWQHGRFQDPYLRDALQDFGLLTDTLECAVTWDNLARVHREVRAVAHARPRTLCMTHLSHCYPQGANLYFIFVTPLEAIPEYLDYQAALLDAIQRFGATMSHHHGIGKMTAPWLEGQIGAEQLALFRAIKRHLDPQGIMNPGGTLGLDLEEAERRESDQGAAALAFP